MHSKGLNVIDLNFSPVVGPFERSLACDEDNERAYYNLVSATRFFGVLFAVFSIRCPSLLNATIRLQ